MGEIADSIIEGVFCSGCGCILDGEEPGFTRWCWDCRDEAPGPENIVKRENML